MAVAVLLAGKHRSDNINDSSSVQIVMLMLLWISSNVTIMQSVAVQLKFRSLMAKFVGTKT